MRLSAAGAAVMHQFEGCRSRPYLCPSHIWTTGFGHVLYQQQIRLPMTRSPERQVPMIRKEYPLRPEDNRVFSKDEIDALFEADVAAFERGVLRLAPALDSYQGPFDACVSFSYNVGLGNFQRSSVRMKVQREDWDGAAKAFMLWTKGGGRVLPGLVKRRQAEAALFTS